MWMFGVCVVVINSDGYVVLVCYIYVDYWYFFGGGVKKGESCEVVLFCEFDEEIVLKEFVIECVVGVYYS